MKKTTFALLAASFCATTWAASVVHVIAPGQQAQDVAFPALSEAWRQEGVTANREYLAGITPGMTKQELITYFGKPHFSEGLFAVREWNYIFHFRDAIGGEMTCQYQVRFDSAYRLDATYWESENCAQAALIPNRKVGQGITVEIINQAPAIAAPPAKNVQQHSFLADAFFDFNNATLTPFGQSRIEALVKQVKDGKKTIKGITVTGHADRLGTDAVNIPLSTERAQAVKLALVAQGVDAMTITANGRGSKEPVKSCPGAQSEAVIACLAQNRRVDLSIETLLEQ